MPCNASYSVKGKDDVLVAGSLNNPVHGDGVEDEVEHGEESSDRKRHGDSLPNVIETEKSG